MKKSTRLLIIYFLAFVVGAFCMYLFITLSKDDNCNIVYNDNGISAGIENIYDAVVVVENYKNNKLFGNGSGFIYDKNGYIITNQHVIAGAGEIKVVLENGQSVKATLIGADEFADIAVIKIGSARVPKVATLGNSENAKLGDTVFTIGAPISSSYRGTVTRGILSGKDRLVEVAVSSSSNDWIMNVMQTDAAINPGNSGGPLCNSKGEVIGVSSMKINENAIEGIGFAITIEDALYYANSIVNKTPIKRIYLGIKMSDMSNASFYFKNSYYSNDNGVLVVDVNAGGPAATSGIKMGDVIIGLGRYNINNVAELRYYSNKYAPGTTVPIKILRNNNQLTLNIKLEES